jgi:hypothetical protein
VNAAHNLLRVPEIYKKVIFAKIAKISCADGMARISHDYMVEICDAIKHMPKHEKYFNLVAYRKQEIEGTIEQQQRRILEMFKRYPMLNYIGSVVNNLVISEYINQVDYVNTIRGENA